MPIGYGLENKSWIDRIKVFLLIATLLTAYLLINKYSEDKATTPLLLGSGLTKQEQADIKVIIWFPESTAETINAIQHSLLKEGWTWETKEKITESGIRAVTISGKQRVAASEEEEIFKWYQRLSKKVESVGGYTYLDERISGSVDIAAYLSKSGAFPKQWVIDRQTSSIAAYHPGLNREMRAGQDLINMQLLTRSGQSGQTLLAIPALLEEF